MIFKRVLDEVADDDSENTMQDMEGSMADVVNEWSQWEGSEGWHGEADSTNEDDAMNPDVEDYSVELGIDGKDKFPSYGCFLLGSSVLNLSDEWIQ